MAAYKLQFLQFGIVSGTFLVFREKHAAITGLSEILVEVEVKIWQSLDYHLAL